jgi:hypothetical protein
MTLVVVDGTRVLRPQLRKDFLTTCACQGNLTRMTSVWEEWDDLLRQRDVDPLDVLQVGGKYQRYLVAIEREAIATARAMGRTWEEIAVALGRTRQAVWQRYRADQSRTWVDLEPANRWLTQAALNVGPPGLQATEPETTSTGLAEESEDPKA